MSEYKKNEPPVSESLVEVKRYLSVELEKIKQALKDVEKRLTDAGL